MIRLTCSIRLHSHRFISADARKFSAFCHKRFSTTHNTGALMHTSPIKMEFICSVSSARHTSNASALMYRMHTFISHCFYCALLRLPLVVTYSIKCRVGPTKQLQLTFFLSFPHLGHTKRT